MCQVTMVTDAVLCLCVGELIIIGVIVPPICLFVVQVNL